MRSFILAAVVLAVLVPATAMPQTTVQITEKKINGEYPKDECGGFWGDSLILTIRKNNQKITDYDFCSRYGKADASVVKDALGEEFLILKFGEGGGTFALTEYLLVFRISDKLVEYARIPVSAPAGFTSVWQYDYKIEKPSSGGLKIILDLVISGDDAEWYPPEKRRIVQIR